MEENNSLKKKVLIFIPEFPALTETFIERDISTLIKRGKLEIKILYIKEGKGQMSEESKRNSFRYRLNPIDSFFSLKYFLFNFSKVLVAWNIINRDLTKPFYKKLHLFLKSVGYTNVIASFRPDEIHAHFLSEPSTIALVASIILEIPLSINAHARDILEYPNLPTSKAKLSKFISVCNKNAYERVKELSGEYKDKIHLIHHGISESEIFSHPVEITKPTEPLIFMGGTRLTEKKGIDYMLEASKILKDRGISHKVVLIGPGPLYHKFSERIKELGLSDTFELLGEGNGAPFKLISQYYRIADIFVLPILQADTGDADGIPNTIIEAALARLPIVTTDAGSVSELVIDDVTGAVVPQKNSEALATEIEKILIDKERRIRLGNSAHERAKQMFDVENNVGRLETLLLS